MFSEGLGAYIFVASNTYKIDTYSHYVSTLSFLLPVGFKIMF